MTILELENYLEANHHISHLVETENERILFRNEKLAWYQNHPDSATAVTYAKLDEMTPEELEREINRGLLVEGMTRITGYFTKISSWNKGKLGELKDRNREANNVLRRKE